MATMTMNQLLTRRYGYRTNLGLSYVTQDGVRVRNYQLLNQDRFAVAIADFDNTKLIRFEFADSVKDDAASWLDWLQGHFIRG